MARFRVRPAPVVGEWSNDWYVVERTQEGWICQCICGTKVLVKYALRSNSCNECRTGRPKTIKCIKPLHWQRMKRKVGHAIARCTSTKHPQYANYGGRGITIFTPWLQEPITFVKYLLTLPNFDDDALVLDRIDNDGNYEPGNLAFVTYSESNKNRRRKYA